MEPSDKKVDPFVPVAKKERGPSALGGLIVFVLPFLIALGALIWWGMKQFELAKAAPADDPRLAAPAMTGAVTGALKKLAPDADLAKAARDKVNARTDELSNELEKAGEPPKAGAGDAPR